MKGVDITVFGAGFMAFIVVYRGINYIIDRARTQTLNEVSIISLELKSEIKELIKKELNEKIEKTKNELTDKIESEVKALDEKLERNLK